MDIPDKQLSLIQREYNEFRESPFYEERKKQLEFCDFAKSILEHLLEKESITNENLTALIQIFGNGSKDENVKKHIESLELEKSYSEDIFNKFIEMRQTGYTGRGKSAITNLTDEQLSIVHEFLKNVSRSNSEGEIRNHISDFDDKGVPQVKYGVYSPWLYYLHPTVCPIVAGPVKEYLGLLGWNLKNYLDAWAILKKINTAVNESDYGFFDAYVYDKGRKPNYWLFIVRKDYENGELWSYCKENSIAAMQYQEGSERKGTVTTNINQIKKIEVGDKIIVYLTDNTVGGIGQVTRKFYEDISPENGFNGRFGQRIGLKWVSKNFDLNLNPIKSNLSNFPKNLSLKTIHSISLDDFDVIFDFVDQGSIVKPKIIKPNLLVKKKQIILYGPPGTGKTYNTKNIAVSCIVFGNNDVIIENQDLEVNSDTSLISSKSEVLDKDSFLNIIEDTRGAAEKDTAEKILQWTENNGFSIRYSEKSANFDYIRNDLKYPVFKIFVYDSTSHGNHYGDIELSFSYLKKFPPFDNNAKRLELLNRFNEVSAFDLVEEDIENRPGIGRNISISNLATESDLNKFLSALNWFIQETQEIKHV